MLDGASSNGSIPVFFCISFFVYISVSLLVVLMNIRVEKGVNYIICICIYIWLYI